MTPANPLAPPKGPWLNVTPAVAGRAALAVGLLACGLHYLVSGRREANLGRMITGALLALGAFVLFL